MIRVRKNCFGRYGIGVLIAALVLRPEEAFAQGAARYAGCYELQMGELDNGTTRMAPSQWVRLRPRFVLDTILSEDVRRELRIVVAPGVAPSPYRYMYWRVLAVDSLQLVFGSSFGGYTISLVGRGDSLVGSARSFTDTSPRPPPFVATVSAVRTSCNAPLRPEQRPETNLRRGVKVAGGDSVRVGDRISMAMRGMSSGSTGAVLIAELEAPYRGASQTSLLLDRDSTVMNIFIRFAQTFSADSLMNALVAFHGAPTRTRTGGGIWESNAARISFSSSRQPDGTLFSSISIGGPP